MLRTMWMSCRLLPLLVVACASSEPTTRSLQESNATGSCAFIDFAKAIECTEVSLVGNDIRYVVSCPPDAQSTGDCFDASKPVCYLYNNVPCAMGSFCAAENQLSLDCSNIFAKSLGSPCSSTDCSGSCVSLADEVAPYPINDNSCMSLGHVTSCLTEDENGGCTIETNEWIDILEDLTRVFASITVSSDGQSSACQVRTSQGTLCSCDAGCPNDSKALSYDCSTASFDVCAVKDCEGNCINNEPFDEEVSFTSQPTQAAVPMPVGPNINWGRITTEQPVMSPTEPPPSPANVLVTPSPSLRAQVQPLPAEIPSPGGNLPPPAVSPIPFPPSPWSLASPSSGGEAFFQESGIQSAQGMEQTVPKPLQQQPLPEQLPPLVDQQAAVPQLPEIMIATPGSAPGVVVFEVSNPEFLGPQINHPWFQRLSGGGGGRRLHTRSSQGRRLHVNSWGLGFITALGLFVAGMV